MTSRLPTVPFDDVIKTRIESNERSYKGILKRFQTLSTSPIHTKTDLEAAHLLLTLEIDAFVQGLIKNRGGQGLLDAANKDVESFDHEIENIGKQREQMLQTIQELERELEGAQEERRNKIEYDGLAKNIDKLPSRSANTETIDRLKSEIESLHTERQRYKETWSVRRTAFDQIVSNLENLGQLVRDEKAEQERRQALDDDVEDDDDKKKDNSNNNNAKPNNTNAANTPIIVTEEQEADGGTPASTSAAAIHLNPNAKPFQPDSATGTPIHAMEVDEENNQTEREHSELPTEPSKESAPTDNNTAMDTS